MNVRTVLLIAAVATVAALTAGGMAMRSVRRIWLRHWVEQQLRGSRAALAYLERPQRLIVAASATVALVLVLAGTLVWRRLKTRETPTKKLPIDSVGVGLLVFWVFSLQTVLDLGKDRDWFNNGMILTLAICAVIGFVAWLIWELTDRHPTVDLSLFRHVVEAGSITHGANRANLALAAASHRIRSMEASLGAALLTRARLGVTPTPAGRFYIREKFRVRGVPLYGTHAIGTSAYAPTLSDWPGGGVVGLHGTNQPGLIPGRPSHGCIRLRNRDIARLYRLAPRGTPIRIH